MSFPGRRFSSRMNASTRMSSPLAGETRERNPMRNGARTRPPAGRYLSASTPGRTTWIRSRGTARNSLISSACASPGENSRSKCCAWLRMSDAASSRYGCGSRATNDSSPWSVQNSGTPSRRLISGATAESSELVRLITSGRRPLSRKRSSSSSSFRCRPSAPRRTETVIAPRFSGRVSMAREARFSSQGRSKSQSTKRGVRRKRPDRSWSHALMPP